MSQFKDAVAAYLGQHQNVLTGTTREYLARLAEDCRTETIPPHIDMLVMMYNLASCIPPNLRPKAPEVKLRLTKACNDGASDPELADILEQEIRELRGNTGVLICPVTDRRLHSMRLVQPNVDTEPGWKDLPIPTLNWDRERFEITIPFTRQGDQQQRGYVWLLMIAKPHTKWTDGDIADLTDIAFRLERTFTAEQVRNLHRRPATGLISFRITSLRKIRTDVPLHLGGAFVSTTL